ncbi:MAG: hypothetical protein LBS49_10165 [Candidatus Accumulibacter sp.]|jgi:hypothetical protein|nr:hypothetical protein [Accumulibacter sp.]
MPEQQAQAWTEALAEALTEAIKSIQSNLGLATRQDLCITKTELTESDVKLAESMTELICWIVGVGVLQTVIIAAVLIMKFAPS